MRTVVSSTGPDFVNIWGIEYNPATNKLFVTQLGAGSMYSILRVNASTGDIETGTFFRYASDLFLTASGNLVVGSWTETARIYNQDMIFVGPLGTEQRFFVTQHPTGEPTPTPTQQLHQAEHQQQLQVRQLLRGPSLLLGRVQLRNPGPNKAYDPRTLLQGTVVHLRTTWMVPITAYSGLLQRKRAIRLLIPIPDLHVFGSRQT